MALRDLAAGCFVRRCGELDAAARSLVGHVITENERVLAAAEALQRGDAAEVGRLMNASYDSLRDNCDLSSGPLNVMVETARRHPACYGAQMGGGFAGCALAIINPDGIHDFLDFTAAEFEKRTGLSPTLYVSRTMHGAETFMA